MIDIIELHEGLRKAGIGPDVPYHDVDQRYELKLQTLREQLWEVLEVEELEGEVSRLEAELDDADDTIDKLREELAAKGAA